MRFKQQIQNERGDAFIIAMMMVAICLVSSFLMMVYSSQIENNSKRPRIKSMMSSIESKVRAVLLTPGSYVGCTSSDVAGEGRAQCDLRTTEVTGLSTIMKDARCPASKPNCGFAVTIQQYDKNVVVGDAATGTQTVTRVAVRITYEGIDFPIRPVDIVVDVPADVLQKNVYECPSARPKFIGFRADGTMNCVALSPKLPPNKFAVGVDSEGLSTISNSFPATDFTCPPDQFFDSIKWVDGGSNIDAHCTTRVSPSYTFGFTPRAVPQGDVVMVPAN